LVEGTGNLLVCPSRRNKSMEEDMKFYHKKKFWVALVGVAAAAGVIGAEMQEKIVQIITIIFGG